MSMTTYAYDVQVPWATNGTWALFAWVQPVNLVIWNVPGWPLAHKAEWILVHIRPWRKGCPKGFELEEIKKSFSVLSHSRRKSQRKMGFYFAKLSRFIFKIAYTSKTLKIRSLSYKWMVSTVNFRAKSGQFLHRKTNSFFITWKIE